MYIHIHTYTCTLCVCVFSALTDEAIFQVIKSNRMYCSRIVVAKTERSYGGEDSYNAKDK